jgi:beta-N-acetylhexosaminidase
MSQVEKIRCLIMAYGDLQVVPRTSAIIVNQHHLTATGVPMLQHQLALAMERMGFPVLVGTDQEGGKINRLKNFPPTQHLIFPSPQQMLNLSDRELMVEGAKTASALRLATVNLLLAPVLDAADPGTLMCKQGRSFGSDPIAVTERAQHFVAGLRSEYPSLVIIAKHFPGYNVKQNTDNVAASDGQNLLEEENRGRPFFQVGGLDGIMVNSIRYNNIDPGRPACFSKSIIDQWRSQFPNGLIMTDDLTSKGLSILGSPQANAKSAFLAGIDMILVMDGAQTYRIEQGINDALCDTSVPPEELTKRQSQLDASVARVLDLANCNRAAFIS